MILLIHDIEKNYFDTMFSNITDSTYVISDNGTIKNCIGCFGCWIKTPGQCVLKDGYENMGYLFSKADKVVIISKCFYGGYSPFVKNILDRSISYLLPYFTTKGSETHHKQRYIRNFTLKVYFYGNDILPEEIEVAEKLVEANSINFYANQYSVSFFENIEEISKEVSL